MIFDGVKNDVTGPLPCSIAVVTANSPVDLKVCEPRTLNPPMALSATILPLDVCPSPQWIVALKADALRRVSASVKVATVTLSRASFFRARTATAVAVRGASVTMLVVEADAVSLSESPICTVARIAPGCW